MMLSKISQILFFCAGLSTLLQAQDTIPVEKPFIPSSKVSSTIFTSAQSSFIDNEVSAVGFVLDRAYFGLTHQATKEFSAEVKIDVGSPKDISAGELQRRFMYVRNAYGMYVVKGVQICFGLINLHGFKLQENTWGNRYVYASFMDKHKWAQNSDMGISAMYKIDKSLSVDFSMTNGEGYSKIQADKDFVYTFGSIFSPTEQLTFRVFGDYSNLANKPITLGNFVSFKPSDVITLSCEYNFKFNEKGVENHNLQGVSSYASYAVSKQVKLFARYDQLWSNILENEQSAWNNKKDGRAAIGGVEYSPIKNLRFAANYQGWFYANTDLATTSVLGIFAEIKF